MKTDFRHAAEIRALSRRERRAERAYSWTRCVQLGHRQHIPRTVVFRNMQPIGIYSGKGNYGAIEKH